MWIAVFLECYTPIADGVVASIQTLHNTLRGWGHRVAVFAPGAPQPDDGPDIFRLPDLPFPDHHCRLARPFKRLKIEFARRYLYKGRRNWTPVNVVTIDVRRTVMR